MAVVEVVFEDFLTLLRESHSGGGSWASSGWKLHDVGGVRSSTASAALATWAQSEAEMTWPEGAPVARSARFVPIKSEQD